MTNSEYEKASVQAATGESLVRAADEKIKELESALEVARERRRELVNRYDLNKLCEHDLTNDSHKVFCIKCGETYATRN